MLRALARACCDEDRKRLAGEIICDCHGPSVVYLVKIIDDWAAPFFKAWACVCCKDSRRLGGKYDLQALACACREDWGCECCEGHRI